MAGANGTITGNTPQTVEHGQDGTEVTAVPNTGYHFVQWSDGVTTAARTDLGVTGDINVTAEFAVDKWQVTFSVIQDGQPVESAQILISSVGTDLLTDNTGQAVTTLPDGNYLYDVIINSLLMIDDATLEVSGADATENITINATLVSSAEHSTISIWPNPVKEVVWIESNIHIAEITVFDMAGNLIVLVNNPEEKVNLSFLPPGFYLLKITDAEGKHTVKRIIKK